MLKLMSDTDTKILYLKLKLKRPVFSVQLI